MGQEHFKNMQIALFTLWENDNANNVLIYILNIKIPSSNLAILYPMGYNK
jgi:hypothetical protein